MAKVTFECDDAAEARAFLDMMETRDNGGVTFVAGAVTQDPDPAISTQPENRVNPGQLDVHGMPWNEAYHSTARTINADGSYKALKGKATECKAAVAAFKAAGGNQPAPAADTFTVQTGIPASLPGATAPAAGLPGAIRTEDMAPPVSQAQLEEKMIGMINRGLLDPASTYGELLDRHGVDRGDPAAVLSTNETLRAAVFADCCTIEPEMA